MNDVKRKYPRSGQDVNGWKQKATDRNTGTLSSSTFLKACEHVGIEPTRRQASKYSRGLGLAVKGRDHNANV